MKLPKDSHTNQRLGAEAEEAALKHLSQAGLRLLTRNYLCRGGEIDLIMRDRHSLVFVEVRYRSRSGFATALESVGTIKQRRIIIAAHHYLQQQPEYNNLPCRFDVVAFDPDSRQSHPPRPLWLKDAFQLTH